MRTLTESHGFPISRVCAILVTGFLTSSLCLSATPTHRVVLKPVANMYSSPTMNADVVSQAILGTNIDQVQKRGGWAKVQTPDAYTGWMPTSWARTLGPDENPYASQGRVVRVESLQGNLYREPDVTKHEPVMTLPFGTRLAVISSTSETPIWFIVRLPDRRMAWIQAGDVTENLITLNSDESIALAKRFIGITYLWGGVSSFGFDCSGFTQMVIFSRGALMPRDADLQAAWNGVVPVDKDHLQPGDLLFFGRDIDHISHTGMCIGEGRFIHDTTHGHPGVQIGILDDEHWKGLLVASRRLK